MSYNDLKILRDAMLAHGRNLDRLPAIDPTVRVTDLGSGGAMLSPGAPATLVDLLRGKGDLCVMDRDWLRQQLRRLGLPDGDIELLTDMAPPPRGLALMLPFTLIASAE